MTLPDGCNITFEADGRHFLLQVPYNKDFLTSLGFASITDKAWLPESRAWRVDEKWLFDCMDLCEQFFGTWKDVPMFGYMEGRT